MSQYLSFNLKQKENPEIKIRLTYYCTTVARELSSLGCFPYAQEEVKLDIRGFRNSIDLITEQISEYNRRKDEIIESKVNYQELLCKAATKEALKYIQDLLSENDLSIASWVEEIEYWTSIRDTLIVYLNILEHNEDTWELYYTNH